MGRSPCCDTDANVKKGPWTTDEDKKLMDYIEKHGPGNWRHLPKKAGLNRCGKSCRLRWTNYLRPDIKRGTFSEEEERHIINLHSVLGNKWSAIANQLPGRTDNEIKNYWNTHIRKKLLVMGIDPVTHRPRTNLSLLASLPNLIAAVANMNNLTTNPMMNALQLPRLQLLQTLMHSIASGFPQNMDGTSNPLGTPIGLQNLNQTPGGFPNLSMNGSDFVQPMNFGSCNSSEFGNGGTSSTTTTATTTSLASGSPENCTLEQAPDPVNSGDVSGGSPTSTPFEPWRNLTLDDLNSDLGWKDILDQISWSNPLEQDLEILKK